MGPRAAAQKTSRGGLNVAPYRFTLKIYSIFICSLNLTGHPEFYLATVVIAGHKCENVAPLNFLGTELLSMTGV